MCLMLSRCRTYTPTLQWMEQPLVDLADWLDDIEKVEKLEKDQEKRNKSKQGK